ncbi:MAG TPA: HAD-IIIC family phosphatase [Vicinamibacterales bacterium]
MPPLSGLLVSSFNLGNFSRCLESDEAWPIVQCTSTPFGQVMASLLSPADQRSDFAVVWTSPDQISPAFKECLEHRGGSVERALADVDEFTGAVRQFAERVDHVFVPAWVPTVEVPTSTLTAMRERTGSSSLLLEMNGRLAANLRQVANVHVLDAAKWMEAAAGSPRDPKLWYLAKVPFANDVFVAATRDIKSCLSGLHGKARRLVVLDLDDTMWGGLVGDVGWEKLRIGGHDAIGEAYADFQRGLKALARRGVILAVVSKNEEAVALEAIDRHPEMVLRREDFAGWRINRQDKAANIVDLVHELRLGLDAVVFIDDSPAERARVRESLPEVLVPEWPSDGLLYPRALAALRCFDQPASTAEDAHRVSMYNAERSRSELLARIGSVDEWLSTLDLKVAAEDAGGQNFARVLQLLNKTNQMNLATRRMTEPEFRAWLAGPDRKSWCFRVSDRLGDSGITGLLSIEEVGRVAEVRDFLLSCRVMGRKIEETMLHVAVDYARSRGLREVRLAYEPTPRNQPCLDFLKRVGFPASDGDYVYIWPTDREYPLPGAVECSVQAWKEVV